MSQHWKKYLSGALVGALIALLMAWAYLGNSSDLQGKFKFKSKITPMSTIKVINR